MDGDERSAYGRVIAQAWTDEGYRERLNKDAVSVLSEAGIDMSGRDKVVVLHDTGDTSHIVIPAKPDDLNDDHIARVHSDATKICC